MKVVQALRSEFSQLRKELKQREKKVSNVFGLCIFCLRRNKQGCERSVGWMSNCVCDANWMRGSAVARCRNV
jgi:hypothetical protein